MARPLALVFLGLSVAAGCTVGDTGSSGGGPDAAQPGADSAGGEDAPITTPRVASAIDKSAVSSELGKNETVTLTLTSQGGFAGPVTITASLVDGQGQPLTPVTVQGPATLTLTAGQSMPAAYTISIPTDASGGDFTGTLKLDLTSSAGTAELTSSLSIAATYTFDIAAGTGTSATAHPGAGKTVAVKRGAKIAVHNSDSIQHVTHAAVLPHEADAGGQPGATYVMTTSGIAPGTANVVVGCHTGGHGGGATYAAITVE